MKKNFPYNILCFCFFIAASCKENKQDNIIASQPIFQLLESNATGLNFTNTLTPTPTFNMFKYMYFYNGAGVG
ncbi:MAG TPA: hypothetical protein PL045_13290, partial [Chitinophagaceae bacterium]|nr:hypothetical protein [Chitinophagaceae bacterium]